MDPAFGIALALFLVLLNGFFVAAEFAIVKVRRTRLEEMRDGGDMLAGRALGVTGHLDAYLAATQLGITIASLGLGWIGEPAVASIIEPPLVALGLSEGAVVAIAFALGFGIITLLHITMGELAPKSIAILKPEATSRFIAFPLQVFYTVMRPAIVVLNGTANLMLRLVGVGPASEDEAAHTDVELRMILASSGQSGTIDRIEEELAVRSLTFGDVGVADVMVPRVSMHALPMDLPLDDARKRALAWGHALIPAYGDSADDVRGVVGWTDLFDPAVEAAPGWPARVRPIVAIPDSLSASRALERLRDADARIALVIDESGGTAGVLTLDDLVAGIVARVETLRPDRLPGATSLHELASELGLHVPDDVEATTIGGLVAERLGRFPRSGDEVRIEGWRIVVLEADGRGAAVVRLERPGDAAG